MSGSGESLPIIVVVSEEVLEIHKPYVEDSRYASTYPTDDVCEESIQRKGYAKSPLNQQLSFGSTES